MIRRVIRRPRAVHDLLGHYESICCGSPAAADRFIQAAEAAIDSLVRMPGMGSVAEFSSPRLKGVRVWPIPRFRKYLVFYRLTDEVVEILHVLHGSQDIETLFVQETDQ